MSLGNSNLLIIIIIKLGYNKLSSNTSLFPVQFRFMFCKKIMFSKYVDHKYTLKPLFLPTILELLNDFPLLAIDGIYWNKFIHIYSLYICLSILDIWLRRELIWKCIVIRKYSIIHVAHGSYCNSMPLGAAWAYYI